jgi:hypothetical protein
MATSLLNYMVVINKLDYYSNKHVPIKAHMICHLVELFCDNNNVILEFADA